MVRLIPDRSVPHGVSSSSERDMVRHVNNSSPEEEGVASSFTQTSNDPNEERFHIETTSLLPDAMHFHPSQYKKTLKIATRCYIAKAVDLLERILDPDEIQWFVEHPQFKHFFHMHRDANHKMMGMWMLILRKAVTKKSKECWFVVNGVPIRYSIHEHGLISGLHCHSYPGPLDGVGNLGIVRTQFDHGTKITYDVVEEKLRSMGRCGQRLNIAVLYFLSSIIVGKKKTGKAAPPVEPLFLRAVGDLELCRTFPWGRYSCYANMKELSHWMDFFDGNLQGEWVFPTFVTPLELLPFEAIPELAKNFIEEIVNEGVDSDCPRMCKGRYKTSAMRGFPLEEINEALGTTKDIHSILEPTFGEEFLLARIMGDEDEDVMDAVPDGWTKIILTEKRKVWFESFYNEDVAARTKEVAARTAEVETNAEARAETSGERIVDRQNVEMVVEIQSLKEAVTGLTHELKGLTEKFDVLTKRVGDKFEGLERRVKVMQDYIQEVVAEEDKEDDMVFQRHDQEDVQVEEAGEKEGDKEGEEGEKEGEDVEKEAEEVEKEKERREEVEKEKEGEDVEKEAEEVEKEKERREEVEKEKEGEDVEKEAEEVEKEKERREEVEKEGEDVEKEAEEVEKEKERGEKKDKFLTTYERRAKGKKTPSTVTKEGGRKVKRVPKKRGQAKMSGYRAPSTRNTRRSGN